MFVKGEQRYLLLNFSTIFNNFNLDLAGTYGYDWIEFQKRPKKNQKSR